MTMAKQGPFPPVACKIYRMALPIPFPLRSTNVYFVDDSPKTLIDTGIKTEASFEALRTQMEAMGFELNSIERILITHGHIDHYGQAKRIASLSGATIHIHPLEYGRTRSIIHSLGILKALLLRNGVPEAPAQQTVHYIESAQRMADPLEEAFFLSDGDPIPFESMRWRAIHCPGHSPGLFCFYWEEEGILLTGDHLLKEVTPNPILNIPRDGPPYQYPSLKQYLASLDRMKTMDLRLLLPGHGEEIDDPRGLLQAMDRHHRGRMDFVQTLLASGEKTPYEVAMALFPGVPAFEVFLAISEVLGHLEILKEKGLVRVKEKDGVDRYSLTAC